MRFHPVPNMCEDKEMHIGGLGQGLCLYYSVSWCIIQPYVNYFAINSSHIRRTAKICNTILFKRVHVATYSYSITVASIAPGSISNSKFRLRLSYTYEIMRPAIESCRSTVDWCSVRVRCGINTCGDITCSFVDRGYLWPWYTALRRYIFLLKM